MGAARTRFPVTQPHCFGTFSRDGRNRGGAPVRLANHSALCGGAGREVFAAPGSPLAPRAEGTNDLPRQGATLCAGAADCCRRFRRAPASSVSLTCSPKTRRTRPPLTTSRCSKRWICSRCASRSRLPSLAARATRQSPQPRPHPPRRRLAPATPVDVRAAVTALLGPSPILVDELIRVARLPAREVQEALIELDRAGRLARHGGNLVSLS